MNSKEISKLPGSSLPNYSTLERSTGDIGRTQVFNFFNLQIVKKTNSYGYIQGSLHYFKNHGHHNYDDFKLDELWRCLEKINSHFNISVEFLPLVQLEFGLNITPQVASEKVLDSLFLHQGKLFKNMYLTPGSHRLCHHEDYDIKVYDKKAQFYPSNIKNDLIRVELHANRARPLNILNCYCLNDLRDESVRYSLLNWLLSDVWPKILFVESAISTKMILYSNKEVQKVKDWSNPLFWKSLNNQTKKYNRKKLKEFLERYKFSLQEDLQMSLMRKSKELYQFPC